MWIVSWVVFGALIMFVLYKLKINFEASLGITALIVVVAFSCISILNISRLTDKFNEYSSGNDSTLFAPAYEYRHYLHLTTNNYTEDRELIIYKTTYPQMVESKYSNACFYQFDIFTANDNSPFENVIIRAANTKIILIDGVIPCFKKLIFYQETTIPYIFKLLLPKNDFQYIPKYPTGILYLPKPPIFIENDIPSFLEYDTIKAYDIMDTI
jgi:hypothetical protein